MVDRSTRESGIIRDQYNLADVAALRGDLFRTRFPQVSIANAATAHFGIVTGSRIVRQLGFQARFSKEVFTFRTYEGGAWSGGTVIVQRPVNLVQSGTPPLAQAASQVTIDTPGAQIAEDDVSLDEVIVGAPLAGSVLEADQTYYLEIENTGGGPLLIGFTYDWAVTEIGL